MGYNDKPSVSLSDLLGDLAESANNSTKSANLFIKNRRIKENEEHKKLWSQKIIFMPLQPFILPPLPNRLTISVMM